MSNDTIAFRLNGELCNKIDNWRRAQPVIPSKVEAVRFLIESGLAEAILASLSTGTPQAFPQAAHNSAPRLSPELPLSTATLQQTDNLNVGSSLAVENGGTGDNSADPKKRMIERAEDEAHQKLFRTGIADLCEVSGLGENDAHDMTVNWVLKSSALHVLTLIEAVKAMGNIEPGAVAPLISSQVHGYKPIAGLPPAAEGD